MVLLDGDDVPELVFARVAGGTVAAYTARAPDKSTSNEDSVAVIPYGPGAAVFAVADGAGGLPEGRRASRAAVNKLDESLQDSMQKRPCCVLPFSMVSRRPTWRYSPWVRERDDPDCRND
jgi:hypothetical protein